MKDIYDVHECIFMYCRDYARKHVTMRSASKWLHMFTYNNFKFLSRAAITGEETLLLRACAVLDFFSS
jgi:hypothetical protein